MVSKPGGAKEISGALHLLCESDFEPGSVNALSGKIVLVERTCGIARLKKVFKAGAVAVIVARSPGPSQRNDDFVKQIQGEGEGIGDFVSIASEHAEALVKYATKTAHQHTYDDQSTDALKFAFAAFLWHAGLVPAVASAFHPTADTATDGAATHTSTTHTSTTPSSTTSKGTPALQSLKQLWQKFSNALRLSLDPPVDDDTAVRVRSRGTKTHCVIRSTPPLSTH